MKKGQQIFQGKVALCLAVAGGALAAQAPALTRRRSSQPLCSSSAPPRTDVIASTADKQRPWHAHCLTHEHVCLY